MQQARLSCLEPLDGDFSIGLLACLLSARYFSKLPFCVARINVFEIFGEGFRQLKLFWASLTLQGPECIDPTFSRWWIKRRGQHEKVASSNRLPRFLIGACSALVLFERGAVCEFPSR